MTYRPWIVSGALIKASFYPRKDEAPFAKTIALTAVHSGFFKATTAATPTQKKLFNTKKKENASLGAAYLAVVCLSF